MSRSIGRAGSRSRPPMPPRSIAYSLRPNMSRASREMNQRLVVASMEPRGATASHDAASDSYLLRVCSQGAGAMRDDILVIMGWPKEKLRVTTEDVGGAFGLKTSAYPEYIALLVGAKKIGRPIHWMSGRSEAFLTDNQGRDIYSEAELALDEKGKFLALRIRNTGNMGAYVGAVGANIPRSISRAACPACTTSSGSISRRNASTPTRSRPRPIAAPAVRKPIYVLERLVDEAARISGIDPVKLRRRNLIKKSPMPYKTAIGTTFDSGDFEPILDKALELADYNNFKRRRREAQKRGKYRGLGISCMLEHAGGAPLESAMLSFPGGDKLLLTLNVQNTGQGHATVFSRVIADRLGIPSERFRTQRQFGERTAGLRLGRLTLGNDGRPFAGQRDRHHPRKRASRSPPPCWKPARATSPTRTAFRSRRHRPTHHAVRDRRTRRRDEEARRDRRRSRHKTVTETPLTFPNGVHIAEVEIDPATGRHGHRRLFRGRRLRQAARSHDRRRPAARLVGCGPRPGADGEHGLRQRLGQLVTGSFMDYAMPRAEDMPPLREACITCRRRPIRSASKASAKPAPRRRSRR